jgi:hypothetical protein
MVNFIEDEPQEEGWYVCMDSTGRVREVFVTHTREPPTILAINGVELMDSYTWAVEEGTNRFLRPGSEQY